MTATTVVAPNTALRAVRERLGHSQEAFAAAVREAGDWLGTPNNCAKRAVQMWEAGTVRSPRATTLRAIEHVTGLPAAALGFESAATADPESDPARPMASDGPWIPVADPRVKPGPLSGIWLSDYEYHSTSRNENFHGTHYTVLIQHGSRIQARSTPGSRSRLKIDMTVNGQIFNGTWAEETDPNGYYHGTVYYGAIHMIGDPAGQEIAGKWVGFGKGGEVNDGPWTLKRLTGQATTDDITHYSKPTGQDDT